MAALNYQEDGGNQYYNRQQASNGNQGVPDPQGFMDVAHRTWCYQTQDKWAANRGVL